MFREAAQSLSLKAVPVSRGLGWFSIALGAGALFAPRKLSALMGVRGKGWVQAVGAREIAAGVGLLAKPAHPAAAWSRVAGDAMDIALLAAALRSPNSIRKRTAGALAFVVGVTALDVLWSLNLSRNIGRNHSFKGEAA
ncbi:MAG TPA: hypothetical protein VJU83_03380 [Burkholderiales bacterium]|nr:hypothetical protein [Burkholderiales bacterium]